MNATAPSARRKDGAGERWRRGICGSRAGAILARRVKTPRGEIDLIARRGRRGGLRRGEVAGKRGRSSIMAIDAYRLRRVAAAAEAVAHRYARRGDDQRIDVLLLAPGRLPRHIGERPDALSGARQSCAYASPSRWTRSKAININGDSSFALMLAAQARGHSLCTTMCTRWPMRSGRLTAWAAPVTVQRVAGDHFSHGRTPQDRSGRRMSTWC